jgi:hypothetical protein
MSADELLVDESVNLTEEQRRYIKNFIHEWEEEQDKYADGGETYDKTLFQKELAEFKKHIKDGYGWISPTYVLDTWESMRFKTDINNVNSPAAQDLYKDLIDSKLLYHEEYGTGEKGERVESFKELYGWNYGENLEYAKGGEIAQENNEMLQSNIVEVKHHANELDGIVTDSTEVEPWVIAKTERASTDLSDVTHYLDGEKKKGLKMPFEKGGYMAEGGMMEVEDDLSGLTANIYRSTYDSETNKMYGKDSVTIIDKEVPEIFKANESRPAVRLIRRKFRFGNEEYTYVHAVPYGQNDNEGMFGGTFIYSSDSRFPSKYPIPLHDRVESYEKGGYMADGGMTAKERKIASQLNQNSKVQKTMTVADKANRFLQAVRVADNDIKLKDITVEASPRGNWVVFEHGKVIMTVNQDMLDEETIRTYNLEHHN